VRIQSHTAPARLARCLRTVRDGCLRFWRSSRVWVIVGGAPRRFAAPLGESGIGGSVAAGEVDGFVLERVANAGAGLKPARTADWDGLGGHSGWGEAGRTILCV
jgi:hypothetical protein